MGISEQDRAYLRQCVDLARQALERGNDPFGSILVDGKGVVRYTDHNRVKEKSDVTWHPEFTIVVWAQTHLSAQERATSTVYTSGEHCAMCSTAHGYAGLGRIVFASSSAQFESWLDECGIKKSFPGIPVKQVLPQLAVDGPDDEVSAEVHKLVKQHYSKKSKGL